VRFTPSHLWISEGGLMSGKVSRKNIVGEGEEPTATPASRDGGIWVCGSGGGFHLDGIR
jgi:hypothetical protein